MLACLVEKPPVAVVVIEWHTASNSPMPPAISSALSTAVNNIYTIKIYRAITRVLGQSLLWVTPVASDR